MGRVGGWWRRHGKKHPGCEELLHSYHAIVSTIIISYLKYQNSLLIGFPTSIPAPPSPHSSNQSNLLKSQTKSCQIFSCHFCFQPKTLVKVCTTLHYLALVHLHPLSLILALQSSWLFLLFLKHVKNIPSWGICICCSFIWNAIPQNPMIPSLTSPSERPFPSTLSQGALAPSLSLHPVDGHGDVQPRSPFLMEDFVPSCWDTDVIQEHSLSTLSVLNISGCAPQRTQPVMPSITFSSTRTYLISFYLLIVCICWRSVGIGTLFWNCCTSSTTAWHIQGRCSVNTSRMWNELSLPPQAALHNCGCWERVSLECATLAHRFFQAESNECPTNSGKVVYLPLPA